MLEDVSSLRRIVRTPKRWDRIVQLAATKGEKLPAQPDSKALNDFLLRRKAADPDHFADVSLVVIKLIKVEREMSKRLAAVAMQSRIGEVFDAIVTGVNDHGTFVRVLQPRLEGLLTQGAQGLDVGDKLRAKLIRTDVSKGYIDFARS